MVLFFLNKTNLHGYNVKNNDFQNLIYVLYDAYDSHYSDLYDFAMYNKHFATKRQYFYNVLRTFYHVFSVLFCVFFVLL